MVVDSYHTGHHRLRTFLLLQRVLLDSAASKDKAKSLIDPQDPTILSNLTCLSTSLYLPPCHHSKP